MQSASSHPLRILPFKTNDRVALAGDFKPANPRTIAVNGAAHTTLERRGFLVLAILVAHGLHLSGRPPPFPTGLPPFPRAKDIADLILALKSQNPAVFQGMFGEIDDQAVTSVLSDLRALFKRLGSHPMLLETGPSRRGFRLSTPPENLSIDWQERIVLIPPRQPGAA
ncbi:MAG: hypothetical protein KA118_11015 [Verrucomicrobia bacterium]|nr:hypothetical protein [Verrucomicrobiota bacterium]